MRIGLVVHPTREVDAEMDALNRWADDGGRELVQVDGGSRSLAERGEVEECELVLTLGGDGTALTGMELAANAGLPVLAVACGSLGVLTAVGADDLPRALDRFCDDDWVARPIPALDVAPDEGEGFSALNDVAVIRDGEGQVTTSASVDGALYGRFVGDGFVVATPFGSSAYTFAAGGPLLTEGTSAYVLTPLSSHGGTIVPLVVGSGSELEMSVDPGHAGARLEVDGAARDALPGSLRIGLRPDAATLVGFSDVEPFLSGLRRREIIVDSPRVRAREAADRD